MSREATQAQANGQPTVVRTGRGLSVAGTRLTLYSIMDFIKAEWPSTLIRDWFNLTDQQITDVLAYIDEHRAEVEAEYQLVLQQAEEHRRYWEERNRERFAQIAAQPPKPGQEAIRTKLAAHKAKLAHDEDLSCSQYGRIRHHFMGNPCSFRVAASYTGTARPVR